MNNIFYLLKGEQQTAVNGRYDTKTGDYESTSEIGHYCLSTRLTDLKPSKRLGTEIIAMLAPDINFASATILYYGKNSEYLGFTVLDTEELNSGNLSELINQKGLDKVHQIALDFSLYISEQELSQMTQAEINSMLSHVWVYAGFKLQEPHYSKLENKYKKETGQVFFRSSLEGSVKIFGTDFDFINSQSLETKYLLLVVDTNYKLVSSNSFAKTDCKLDDMRHSIELKLSPIDRYSKIMNKYDNTYDLIKLSPAITPLTLTKRLLYQFYIQGANSVSCYANGTYWEQDVNEAIDNADALEKKYYFSKNLSMQEFLITDEMCQDYSGTYSHVPGTPPTTWVNQTSGEGHIKMVGISDLSYVASGQSGTAIRWFSTGELVDGHALGGLKDEWKFVLKIYDDRAYGNFGVAFSQCIFVMPDWNVNSDDAHMGNAGEYKFSIRRSPTEVTVFSLDVINYTVWARVLADVDTAVEPSSGQTKTLYDLPKDDFVSERVNYRKCIGLIGLQVRQSGYTVKHPTKYGRNDYGNYFTNNFVNAVTKTEHMPVPISRSTWANTSIWAIIPDTWSSFESQFRTQFTLKDAFSLADTIKALLHKIDPLVKFEATAEYSRFFYEGDTSTPIIPFDGARVGYVPFIAPKSNVLKGNYDQAAQKAEISFEQLMNMLRDCFRCYWYIDDNNRLRIEHISYFMKGLSYVQPNIQLDLTKKLDKFNKKLVLYAQEATSYIKDDLNSRYEFSWMDDSTDTFDDMEIDVKSLYVQSDKTEEINSDMFSSDIDLMLYAPDKFSEDGFALMMANKDTGKVPIASVSELRDDEYVYTYRVTPQNYLCSWLYLARYYMLDMPAYKIEYTRAPITDAYRVTGLKQFKQQDIEFQTSMKIDLNKAIKTSVGIGTIDSMSVNIDTHLISTTLVYSPY